MCQPDSDVQHLIWQCVRLCKIVACTRRNVIVDGVAASTFVVPSNACMGLDAVAAERVKGRTAAKWRLAWRAAPALIKRLRASGLLKDLNLHLSAFTQQVCSAARLSLYL